MLLVAIKPHGYAGKNISTGEQYEALEPFATALVGAGVSRYRTDVPEGWTCDPGPRGEPGPAGEGPCLYGPSETYIDKDGRQITTRTQSYETMEQKPEPISPDNTKRKKRQYKRRDMNPKE